MYPVYSVPAGDILPLFFSTYGKTNGESITLTGLAVTDIEIYKDGGTTQRASDAGYTLLDTDGIDFDSITGIHGFSIDTGDNTDAGFYTVGAWFHVVVSAVTVDSQTVNFIAAAFRIMPAESVAGKPKVDVDAFGGSAGTFSSGRPEVNTTHAAGTAWGSGAITAAALAADAITAAKLHSDVTTELQSGLATASALTTVGSNVTAIKAVTDLLPDGGALTSLGGEISDIVEALSIHTGTAQAGAAGTLTLDTGASSVNDFYNDTLVLITSGTGVGQVRHISDYVGSTRVATVKPNWITTPDNTSVFRVLPETSAWDHVAADHQDAGSLGAVASDILTDTAVIGAAGAGLTAVPWNAAWDAEVQSEVQDAVEVNHLDHLLAVTYDPASKPGAADALLNELVESDGGVARYTSNALEQGPSGGGAVADWTADERTAIRAIFGIPGSGTTPADPSTGILDTIRDSVATRASQSSVDDIPTNAELATALGTADDAVLAAIAALNNLSPAGVRTAIGLASANLDTQLDALPTNAELATALGTADDAVLAAVAALNNLSAAQVRTAVGLASANLDTQLGTLATAANLTLVKAKTDQLTFTTANVVDANAERINNVALVGDGSSTPWGPA